ncbi:MAG: ABC transporter permease [Gudongella sp.]|nr:ABC transporter permease [Gudongella sp.]
MNDIIEYIFKRLLAGILVIFAVTALLFAIMQLMPGDAIELVSSPRVPAEKIEELRALWGLDKPVLVQYFYWLSRIIQGDFGTSIVSGQKVLLLIKERLPYTLMLTGGALIIQYIIAIPLGLIAAYKKDSVLDRSIVAFTIGFWSIPPFWLGILLMIIFGVWLKVLPISGFSGIKSIILPLMTMALPGLAGVLRLTRSEVLEVLRERYVETAYAKGMKRNSVLIKHVLRNALIPVTVMFFLNLPWTIGGSVVIETVFAWPGVGPLLWKSISSQDFPVVQGIIFIIAILTVISNILGDIFSSFLDPRVRQELKGEIV